jgi:pimeloyl-ACP methyl ester carboxylesterase
VEDLRRLRIPVLALYGGNDNQVSIEQNKDRIEGALIRAGVQYEWALFEKANHLFQESETGFWNEYQELDKKFVDGVLDEITVWIHGQFR